MEKILVKLSETLLLVQLEIPLRSWKCFPGHKRTSVGLSWWNFLNPTEGTEGLGSFEKLGLCEVWPYKAEGQSEAGWSSLADFYIF